MIRTSLALAATLAALAGGVPVQAERPGRAWLVRCGAESCLRLTGHRAHPAVAVRVDGRDLAVTGGRSWQATVPLATARSWPIARGYAVSVVTADDGNGTERTERVMLPPGSLGSRVELASLVVRAH